MYKQLFVAFVASLGLNGAVAAQTTGPRVSARPGQRGFARVYVTTAE